MEILLRTNAECTRNFSNSDILLDFFLISADLNWKLEKIQITKEGFQPELFACRVSSLWAGSKVCKVTQY
jgi:hypothetical protein